MDSNLASISGADYGNTVSISSGQELQHLLFNPQAMAQLSSLAELMSTGRVAVPKHFHGNPGDCMAVVMQAAQWRMNPYAVAQKTHVTQGGVLGYEAQLVNAVVSSNAPIKSRLDFEFIGNWEKILGRVKEMEGKGGGKYYVSTWNPADEEGLGVKVWATLKGESEPRVVTVLLKQCWPRFSTQWATDPQQQITYSAVKKWARRHCPDVILGVYTEDELEDYATNEKDVTPKAPAQQTLSACLSDDQVNEIRGRLAALNLPEAGLAARNEVGSLEEIPAAAYQRSLDFLARQEARRQEESHHAN